MTKNKEREKVERKADEPQRHMATKAISELAEAHQEFLDFLERRIGDRAIAEDILQDAFARSIDRMETLRSEESAVAWFYRVLRNALIDYHRRERSTHRALTSFAVEIENAEHPHEEVRNAVCRCVIRLAKTLKPEYANALQRIEIDGLAVKTFAEESGISKSNAAVRVFRAREALRSQVNDFCRACAKHGCIDCTCREE